jgi:hypothetical protein
MAGALCALSIVGVFEAWKRWDLFLHRHRPWLPDCPSCHRRTLTVEGAKVMATRDGRFYVDRTEQISFPDGRVLCRCEACGLRGFRRGREFYLLGAEGQAQYHLTRSILRGWHWRQPTIEAT